MREPEEAVPHVVVRRLRPDDLDKVIALDAKNVGRRRDEYFKVKLAQALSNTGVMVSLAAEHDGAFAGFLLARVYYGEFGGVEQVAVLDTLDVHPEFAGVGVGSALLRQLRTNLLGLGIPVLQTEVSWDQQKLLAFFHHAGFRPAARLCLDLDLTAARRREEVVESEMSA
jgi:ribosomal protein S18 acetylase RimI-like enzyme